jgi:hypothetical protein
MDAKLINQTKEQSAILYPQEMPKQSEFLTVMEGVKTLRFWHLFVMLFCSTFYGMYMAAAYKNFGSVVGGIEDKTLTLAGSFGAVCNGLSRIFWASL